MTAVSPARRFPALTAVPQPDGTPQPTSTAVSSGSHSSTFTTECCEMVARSANVPSMHIAPKSIPLEWNRKLPSGMQLLIHSPEMAAETIVNGVRKGHPRVVIGWEAKAVDVLARIIGPSYQRIVAAGVAKFFPWTK